MTIRKSEKSNYSVSEIWKSIALLSTVSKIIETVTAQYLWQIAEQYHMLSEQQMREQENHSAETALNLLTNQMQAVWDSENYVISLLTLDITGAFDCVLQKCLMHVLQIKEISAELTAWIHIYMIEQSIIIMIADAESEEFQMSAEVLQDFSMSLILYLFYTAELLKICNNSRERLSASVFVDDIILLVYELFMKQNCQILKHAHEVCLKWAYQYEVFFMLKKYDLIHLSDRLSKFNMQITVQLREITKNSDTEIRILEIWINSQLKWKMHVK